jgi:hypothetical protein
MQVVYWRVHLLKCSRCRLNCNSGGQDVGAGPIISIFLQNKFRNGDNRFHVWRNRKYPLYYTSDRVGL